MKFSMIIIICIIIIIVQSHILRIELRREKYPEIHHDELKTGDFVFFSSRPYQLISKLRTLIIRLHTKTEFDHMGLIVVENNSTYILERRGDGTISMIPFKNRLNKFHGYFTIRPLKKKFSRKKERKLLDIAKEYVSDKKKPFPFWRFASFLFTNKTFQPYVSCNDMVCEIFKKSDFVWPDIFPRNQNKENEHYKQIHKLIF